MFMGGVYRPNELEYSRGVPRFSYRRTVFGHLPGVERRPPVGVFAPGHPVARRGRFCPDVESRRSLTMQLPDESIEYDYQGLLAAASEEWTPIAELRAKHFLSPARLKALVPQLTQIRSQ